jgi:Tol biopolymer transport system component
MNPKSKKTFAILTLTALLIGLQGRVLPVYAAPGDLTRVSVDSAGAQANGSSRRDEMSSDGRFVVFESDATNLAGGTGGLFLKDRQTGAVTRVGVDGGNASISNDGRFIAFDSGATNDVIGDTNGFFDIFVFDPQSGLTTRVSVDSSGTQSDANSTSPAISDDGRHVAFSSEANNLVNGDTNNVPDIFVHDRQTGQTRRVSVASDGAEANGSSGAVDISIDGRYVTFSSAATNLVAGDTNGKADIFVHDLQTGGTTRVSVNSSGVQADGGGADPAISGDGRYVVFLSDSGNLDPRADEYRGNDLVYVHDRQIGQTTLASVASDGTILTVGLFDQPTISRDGRYVAFPFYDKGNNDGILDIWVRDLQTGESRQVAGGNDSSFGASLSADGKVVAFWSGASNMVGGDTNGVPDVFVREVAYGPERNPTVASVTPDCGFSTPLCTYPTQASVSFIVNFSEPVTGVTADDFSLDMLESAAGASITGVSGFGVQYFVTVATGTGDGRLRLNIVDNDSILDSALNPLGGVGMGNGSFTTGKLYLIDKSNPAITSIVRADPNPTAAETVHFTVSFSEFVYPVNSNDFALTTTGGISGAIITAIDPREDQFTAAAIYTVTVNTGTGDGTLRLDLIDDDSILDNFIGNPLGGAGVGNGSFTSGEAYTVSKSIPSVPPVVISSLRADANPSAANSVHFTVAFSTAVTGVDAGDFTLATSGGIAGASIAGVSGSGSVYTITVGTGSGDGTLRLDVVDNDSILDSVGQPLGGVNAGNGNFAAGETYTIKKSRIVLVTETFKSNGTNDGWVLESSENSNQGGSKNATATTFRIGDDGQDNQYRAILHFPTHYLPDNAVVTQVILMIKAQGVVGTDPFTTHQNISIDIRASHFGSSGLFGINSLDLTDFQAPANMNSAGVIQNNPVSGWYWALLDGSSSQFINLQGVTQLRLMFQADDNDDLGDDYLAFFSGNQDALSDRPLLLVEYYVQK